VVAVLGVGMTRSSCESGTSGTALKTFAVTLGMDLRAREVVEVSLSFRC
jgi:hypothetical protein